MRLIIVFTKKYCLLSTKLLIRKISVTAASGMSKSTNYFDNCNGNESDDLTSAFESQEQQQHSFYQDVIESISKRWRLADSEQNVFIIQPDYKYKMRKTFTTNVLYQLDESISLIETLPRWHVVNKAICTIKYRRSLFFGPGQLTTLVKQVHQPHQRVSVVFISVNMLTTSQLTRLRRVFGCDVYDRYALVLEIFRRHAKTAEAKLQVALAEFPYVRARLGEIIRAKSMDRLGGGLSAVCGPGETLTEQLKRFLHQRESLILSQLRKVEEQRATLRIARQRRELPTVAIVGYTNAGKTSLARLLSNDSRRLVPDSRLFATLDVTSHGAKLPCGLGVIFLDTVGFLSDLPTHLVAAFKATLNDVKQADLIVHVMDASNPDWQYQREEVLKTLAGIKVPETLMNSIIQVGNKADRFSCDIDSLSALAGRSMVCVSAKTGAGLQHLVEAVQTGILANTGRQLVRLRIPTAGPHLAWLHREHAFVATRDVSADGESLIVDALFTESSHARFRAKFGRPHSQDC